MTAHAERAGAEEPINGLYSRKLLEFAGNITRIGRLENPDASASAVSRLCGSRLQLDIRARNGTITDYAHEVQACALGQTVAAIVAREIIGTPITEISPLAGRMRAMLKEGGPAPEGRWADLAILEAARNYPARHGSVLLVFDALEKALAQIGQKTHTV